MRSGTHRSGASALSLGDGRMTDIPGLAVQYRAIVVLTGLAVVVIGALRPKSSGTGADRTGRHGEANAEVRAVRRP